MAVRERQKMPRTARRYDVYLPITFNDGRPIPRELFDRVERRLLARFVGLTAQQQAFPFRGMWSGGRQLYIEEVIVIASLDYRRRGSARFITQLKQDLLREFDQLEILITEAPLRVH